MPNNNAYSALFRLLDDPDEEVFQIVSNKIISLGKPMLSPLESYWEQTKEALIHQRIEQIIHCIELLDLQTSLLQWCNESKENNLLNGLILITKYFYPHLSANEAIDMVEKIKTTIWIELNNHSSNIEQIHIVSKILFEHYKFKITSSDSYDEGDFLLPSLIHKYRGNDLLHTIFFKHICEQLSIPLQFISFGKKICLVYLNQDKESNKEVCEILIYFCAENKKQAGKVIHYINDIDITSTYSFASLHIYHTILNNQQVIKYTIKELSKCFKKDNIKRKELINLSLIIKA